MDEKRVVEIFWKYLADNSPNETAIIATREIKEKILADILSETISDTEKWELIVKINDAHTRIGYFVGSPRVIITGSESEYLKHLVFILDTLMKGFGYLHEHYESIETEGFKEDNPKSRLQGLIDKFSDDRNSITIGLAITEPITIPRENIQIIQRLLEMIVYVLIGKTSYKLLTEKVAEPLRILARCHSEIMSHNKDTKVH